MPRNRVVLAIAAAALLVIVPAATALGSANPPPHPLPRDGRQEVPQVDLGTAWTYQGRLSEGSGPANGSYDLRFILYDADSGGDQVGDTQTRGDVTVTAGLFTVDLDFGEGAFDGDARWLEIAVRQGSSVGDFTVLSPRQRVSPTPYSLFAQTAGSLALPFSGIVDSGSGSVAFGITQEGAGGGVIVNRSYDGDEDGTALDVVNSGAGAAIEGTTQSDAGVGVFGRVSSGTGTAGRFIGDGAGSRALEIGNGAIQVTGNVRPAFVAQADVGVNTCDGDTAMDIDHPLSNGDPSAIILATPQGDPVVFALAYELCEDGHWAIDTGGALIDGQEFNILIITDDTTS
jgi:hypothetical protein